MSIDMKDVFLRALKTFIQAGGSYFIAAMTGVDFFNGNIDKTILVGVAVSAGAAGLSAVWNTVINPILTLPDRTDDNPPSDEFSEFDD